MTRGLFNSIRDLHEYKEADKNWYVTIERSDFFWYDLIVQPPEGVLENIKGHLNSFKNYVEKTNKKKFIYFFTSRIKVRFDIEKQPKVSWIHKNIIHVYLLIGNKVKKRINILFAKGDVPSNIYVDEKFIYYYVSGQSIVCSIHDFIRNCDINLGITSEIHYVGITSDPVRRTLSRIHRGYADMLYTVPTSDNDIFLTVNTFKVSLFANMEQQGINIMSTNSMIYDVDLEKEGAIIEKSLIYYFKAKCQESDKKAWGELRNLLGIEMKNKNIKSVSFHLEIEKPTEYDIIGSKEIDPKISHTFMWKLVHDEPKLFLFNSEDEIIKQLFN